MPSEASEIWGSRADAELVTQAVSGDPTAFDALFRAHFPKVFNLAFRLTGDRDASSDIAQTTFVRAYRALDRMRDGQAFLKFVYRSAINGCRDHAKRLSRKPWIGFPDLLRRTKHESSGSQELDVSDPSQMVSEFVEAGAMNEALHRSILKLPAEFREALVLHHLQGMDIADMSIVLGVPEGTIKSRLGRARQRLRNSMAGWLAEDSQR